MGSVRGLGEASGRLPRMLVSHFPSPAPPTPQRAQRVPRRGGCYPWTADPTLPAEGSRSRTAGSGSQPHGLLSPRQAVLSLDDSVQRRLQRRGPELGLGVPPRLHVLHPCMLITALCTSHRLSWLLLTASPRGQGARDYDDVESPLAGSERARLGVPVLPLVRLRTPGSRSPSPLEVLQMTSGDTQIKKLLVLEIYI